MVRGEYAIVAAPFLFFWRFFETDSRSLSHHPDSHGYHQHDFDAKMISPLSAAVAATAAVLPFTAALTIDVNSTGGQLCPRGASVFSLISDSLLAASSSLAFGLMSYYVNNATDTPATAVGTLQPPLYWWEAGAVWVCDISEP